MNAAKVRRERMERKAASVTKRIAWKMSKTDKIVVGKIVARACEGASNAFPATYEDVELAFDYEAVGQWEADDPQAVCAAACDFLGIEDYDKYMK